MKSEAKIQHFFDENTHSYSYVVVDSVSGQCAIIDSVLDYDTAAAKISTENADRIIAYVTGHQLKVQWILETHVHADHISAAQYIKSRLGGKIAMSQKIELVQAVFSKIYHLDMKQINASRSFDYLFADHETFKIGNLVAYNIPTPGHTPACLSYVVGSAVFIGDTLFMPDYGSARCDFPKGSAADLYDSVQTLYQLPDNVVLYLCHDYLPEGRENYQYKTNVMDQKKSNIHLHEGVEKLDFIEMRSRRDEILDLPKLILPAIQINMCGGQLPQAESNGIAYLKLPLNYF